MNHITHMETILYVSNQEASHLFYTKLFRTEASLHVPGMTEFTISPTVKIGLMPNQGIAKILTPITQHPNKGNGIPRCELYLRVNDILLEFDNAMLIGATLVSPILDRDWGDKVCYFADPDGHIIAFAKPI